MSRVVITVIASSLLSCCSTLLLIILPHHFPSHGRLVPPAGGGAIGAERASGGREGAARAEGQGHRHRAGGFETLTGADPTPDSWGWYHTSVWLAGCLFLPCHAFKAEARCGSP
jgi:hypothetical protein